MFLAAAALITLAAALAVTPRAQAYVYWANLGPSFDGSTIGRANLNGTGATQSFITGASAPCGVAVNGTHIYWGNSGLGAGVPNAGTIGRANLNGTGVNQFLTSTPDNPCGVALDGTHVYWADGDRVTVGRANLNGSAANPDFITPVPACGVAVDASHIYWGNVGSDSIGRANLNGTGVDTSFISGADGPCGVAVDGSHVYWANTRSTFDGTTIGRANLNGTGVNQSFITGAHGACGVAVNGTHVFWANAATDTIGRALLNGTAANQTLITGANAPCGVAVDAGGAKALPTLTTRASRPITIGGVVRDTAKLAGGATPMTRLILFRLYGPGDANCSQRPVFASRVPVSGNGGYRSAPFRPKRVGTHRFTAIYLGDARNQRVVSACNAPHEAVFVKKATPKLTTTASVAFGNRIGDAATLTGGRTPTGRIVFHVFGPGDANCSGAPVFNTHVVISGNGQYLSRRFVATQPGTYRFTAAYRGDAKNRAARSPCNAPGESVTIP